jgi:predicted nucleotidyltransferase
VKFVCIIAEYNPLHIGHIYHLSQSKSLAECTMVIMGGDFCQRGLSMVMDKYTRAIHAVKAGADIVVELPTVYAIGCAERFALGAMRIIDLLPDSCLSFGSECGDIETLQRTAALLAEPEVEIGVKALVRDGVSYPKARESALKQYASDHNISVADITQPNNILALEYIRAAGPRHPLHTITRTTDYHSLAPTASSSYIRSALFGKEPIEGLVPSYVLSDLVSATPAQEVLYLAALRAADKTAYADLLDNAEGLSNRIWQSAHRCNTLSDAIEDAMTKRYTRARVARLFTAALLGLTGTYAASTDSLPPYFNVLAVRRDRTDLLGELSNYGQVITTQSALAAGTLPQRIDAGAHEKYRLLHAQDVAYSLRIVDC